MRLIRFVLPMLLVGLLTTPVSAQTVTGTVQGTVTDPTGAVLPGVTVTLKNLETGITRELTTNEVGFYSAPFLAVGRYSVSARLSGFGSIVRDEVEVGLNQTRVADFQLKPSTVVEAVTVVGAAPPINTTNAEVKGTLSAQQIMDKPTLNAGSFLSFAEVFAGFQENPTSGQNNPTASSGSSVSFNGTGTRGVTFQINGVNNDDSSENQNRQGVSVSTIQQFQVITNTYSAEFGRGYGAVVLVQTKSGTNSLHGDVYEHLQDSNSLTGLANFATVKPDNQRHQFGGTAGFPIRPNRLFGFASFDWINFEGTQNYAREILLPADLTPRLTRGNDTPANRAWIESIIARFPRGVTPNDPRSDRTYATVIGLNRPAEDFSGRMDWHAGPDTLTGRYQYTHQIFESDDVIIGEAARQNHKQQNLGVTWTRAIRNNLVGEFRYGLGLRDTNVNIAAGNDTPIVRFAGRPTGLGTTLGNAGTFPILRDQLDHQFVYNLSWLSGGESRRQGRHRYPSSAARRLRRQQLARPLEFRSHLCRRHVCDVLRRVSRWLRDDVHEGVGAILSREPNQRVECLRRGQLAHPPGSDAEPGLPVQIVSAPREKEGRIDYGFGDDSDNYEPRLGAAWTLPPADGWLRTFTGGASGDSSLRGGYGIYHGRVFQSVFSQGGATVRFNPPNALTRAISTPNNAHPERLGSDARVRVRARAADHPPHAHDGRPESGDAVHAPVEPELRTAAAVRFEPARHLQRQSRDRHAEVRARQPAAVAARRARPRRRPPEQRAVGGVSGSARQDDRPDRGRRAVRRHGPDGHRGERGLSGPGAHRRQRNQPPRAAYERAPARPALHDEPARQQRRRVLVRRHADRMGEAIQPGAAVPGELHAQQERGHDVGSHGRRGRRLESARPRLAIRARLLALPHAAPLQLQRQLPAAVLA